MPTESISKASEQTPSPNLECGIWLKDLQRTKSLLDGFSCVNYTIDLREQDNKIDLGLGIC